MGRMLLGLSVAKSSEVCLSGVHVPRVRAAEPSVLQEPQGSTCTVKLQELLSVSEHNVDMAQATSLGTPVQGWLALWENLE